MIKVVGDDGLWRLSQEPSEDGRYVMCRECQGVPIDVLAELTDGQSDHT